ncbi:uncharacterized protein [Amphiura filiformis]|uniref:uncharacterized protein isoform X1 n=1 Tax=Amphiura filiformis TaxID=82378 RepID=UPI003B21C59D
MNYKKGVGGCIIFLMLGFSLANILTGSGTLKSTSKPIGVYLIIQGVLIIFLICVIAMQVIKNVINKSNIVLDTVLVLLILAWLIYGTTKYDLDCQPRHVCQYFKSQILLQYIFLLLVCVWWVLGYFLGGDVIWYINEFNQFINIRLQFVTFTICAATGFSLGNIVVGLKFQSDCPREPMIPVFLTCLGLALLLLEGVLFVCVMTNRHWNKYVLFSGGILTLFTYSWIIAGTYWYGHSVAVYSVHCLQTLYLYFVSQLILVYVSVCLLGFMLAWYIKTGVNIFSISLQWIERAQGDDEEERLIPNAHEDERAQGDEEERLMPTAPEDDNQRHYQVAHPQQEAYPIEEECRICFETRRNFFILPCIHRVCRNCGEQLLNEGQPSCPFCRLPFNINDVAET